MPYYLLTSPDAIVTPDDPEYLSKQSAVAYRQPGQTVIFRPDTYESIVWREREKQRLREGVYQPVPWAHEPWINVEHYAHLSLEFPDAMAYTPNEESGHADRQLRTRPGKYLKQFYPQLTQQQIDDYCASIRADRSAFTLTTEPDIIESVYQHGPTSCMSHALDYYHPACGQHPVRVYGNSPDLALVYLGSPQDCSARAIVWPERKIFSRIYGDSALRNLLLNAGYADGSLQGARLRKIAVELDGYSASETYLMPYIDGIDSATIKGKYFILLDNEGSWCCQNTNGLANEIEAYTCLREDCDTEVSGEDQYCDSCNEDRWHCESCHDISFDPDDQVNTTHHTICSSCADDNQTTCANDDCSHEFYQIDLSARQRARRTAAGLSDYCLDCEDDYARCAHCEEVVLIDNPNSPVNACPHCAVARITTPVVIYSNSPVTGDSPNAR